MASDLEDKNYLDSNLLQQHANLFQKEGYYYLVYYRLIGHDKTNKNHHLLYLKKDKNLGCKPLLIPSQNFDFNHIDKENSIPVFVLVISNF